MSELRQFVLRKWTQSTNNSPDLLPKYRSLVASAAAGGRMDDRTTTKEGREGSVRFLRSEREENDFSETGGHGGTADVF